MKKLVLAGFIGALLVGCANPFAPVPYTMKNKFDAVQAEEQLKSGKSSIQGSAFLRQKGGGVVTCAGSEVVLIPYTEYANERLGVLFGSTESGIRPAYAQEYMFSDESAGYKRFVKGATCDAQGKFTFSNLKEGTYFVTTIVSWKVGSSTQGGRLMKKVTLGRGENKELIISL